MQKSSIRLDGKKILITGVSRPMGIGATLARRFAEAGAAVAVHGFSDYGLTTEHLTAMPDGTETVARQLAEKGLNVTALASSDLAIPGNAEKVVEEAAEKIGTLDGLILNHTNGGSVALGGWKPENIDPVLHVNIRASMMMLQSFVAQADTTNDNAITLFTSGQYLSPMKNEMPYAAFSAQHLCKMDNRANYRKRRRNQGELVA